MALDEAMVARADRVVVCADRRAYDWMQVAAWASMIVNMRNALKGVTGGRVGSSGSEPPMADEA